MDNEYMDGWVHTYSSTAKCWFSTIRNNYPHLFSDSKKCLRTANIETATEIIIKCKGDYHEVMKFK